MFVSKPEFVHQLEFHCDGLPKPSTWSICLLHRLEYQVFAIFSGLQVVWVSPIEVIGHVMLKSEYRGKSAMGIIRCRKKQFHSSRKEPSQGIRSSQWKKFEHGLRSS